MSRRRSSKGQGLYSKTVNRELRSSEVSVLQKEVNRLIKKEELLNQREAKCKEAEDRIAATAGNADRVLTPMQQDAQDMLQDQLARLLEGMLGQSQDSFR